MLSARTDEKLKAIAEVARKGRRVKDLRRLMNHPDLWMQAYLNIAGNTGALTKGTDRVTMDGYSPERAANLVELIREGQYRPKPVRRVMIPKSKGGKRPLGVPSADDKLVQEVVHMILEHIYEPLFKESSHGFRPRRSCHTALQPLTRTWAGTKWFIDIDIQGFYDNIHHDILMKVLAKKIEDQQFLALIRSMLDAGYVESWVYHQTYSGTPQGGIVSPILANIYLHELDEFMEGLKRGFDRGKERHESREWKLVTKAITYRRGRIEALKGDESHDAQTRRAALEQTVRELKSRQRQLPAADPQDPNFRRLNYVRYADDVLLGINGSKQDAQGVLEVVHTFLYTALALDISPEKSGIHHAKEGTTFLGYEVRSYTSEQIAKVRSKSFKRVSVTTKRTLREVIQLHIPQRRVSEFCKRKGYGNYERTQPLSNPLWLAFDDEEILLGYNAEMRGFANYYALATGAQGNLAKLMYMAETSFLKTLGTKHKTSTRKLISAMREGKDLVVRTRTKDGKIRKYTLFKLAHWKPAPQKGHVDAESTASLQIRGTGSSLRQRLEADTCEFCGKTGGYFEVHHVKKLKDVQQKPGWQQILHARKRKTMVLCIECHDKLHAGRLSYRPKQF